MGNCFIHSTNRRIIVDESDLDLVTEPGCLVDASLIQKKFNDLKYKDASVLTLASGMSYNVAKVVEINATTVHISASIGSSTAKLTSSSAGVVLGNIVTEARPKSPIHVSANVRATSNNSQVAGFVQIGTDGVVRCYQTSGSTKNYCTFDVTYSIV